MLRLEAEVSGTMMTGQVADFTQLL